MKSLLTFSLLSSLPQALITTYTYDLAFSMTSQMDESSHTTCYEHNAAGRLQLTKDKNCKVVKTFEYKYKQ